MKERLPWFRCFPSALLGAMAGMTPEEGYTYVAVLLRIYETGGPVRETPLTLSRRTGLSQRKVRDAIESLAESGKIQILEDGLIDSETTHDEINSQRQARENFSAAGKSSAAKRAEKRQRFQQNAATDVQRTVNYKEEELEVEDTTPHSARAREPMSVSEIDGLQAKLAEAAGDALDPTSPALMHLAEPSRWLEGGCNLELDVLPVVRARAAASQPGRIRSWSYFTRAVVEARDQRQSPLPQCRAPPSAGDEISPGVTIIPPPGGQNHASRGHRRPHTAFADTFAAIAAARAKSDR